MKFQIRFLILEILSKAVFNTIWNRRNFSAIDHVYSDDIIFEGSTDRKFKGKKQLRNFIISMIASFPDLALSVEDIYWMGNNHDGYLVSIRWGAIGTHRWKWLLWSSQQKRMLYLGYYSVAY